MKEYARRKGPRSGFTLVEMLVVVGIILILMSAIMGGVMKMKKSAMNAKAQDLVTSAATALTAILQMDKNWPGYLIKSSAAGDPLLDSDACQPLISRNVFSVSHERDRDQNGDTYWKLTGQDRCGIADPWAAGMLRRLNPAISGNSALSRSVPSGGTVKDHILRFAIDDDYDGICVARVGGKTVRVRASAVVWCCGANGVFDDYDKAGHSDDIYSWTRSQVQR